MNVRRCLLVPFRVPFLPVVRQFTTMQDPDLIILNPRQSGIVKRKPKKHGRRSTVKHTIPKQGVNPLPVASQNSSSPLTPNNDDQSIVEALHSQKPESSALTQSMYDLVRQDLIRGFKKSQLDEYINMVSKIPLSKYKYSRKSAKADLIMTKIWNLFVKQDDPRLGNSVFVENVIELQDYEFVLVLGNNGSLLREWTKSGAQVSIWPSKCQIIVNSSPQTFQWIEAMLSHFLESIMTSEVDISAITKYINLNDYPEHLAAIQKLTSTYFTGLTADSDTITVVSGGKLRHTNTYIAKRLLLQLYGSSVTQKWKPCRYFYDVNGANLDPGCHFQQLDENDSLEWFDRLRKWSRWESIKTRAPQSFPEPKLEPLNRPLFDESSSMVESSKELNSQLESIIHGLYCDFAIKSDNKSNDMSTTLTITPGFVTHEVQGELLPNAGMRKSFCSTVPYVSRFASTLPMFDTDVLQDSNDQAALSPQNPDELSSITADEKKGDQGGDSEDLWQKIMDLDVKKEEDEGVFVNRHKDLSLQTNLKMIHMKFLPHPSENSEYPPIEAWVEVPPPSLTNKAHTLHEMPKLYAVPLEASAFVSLPTRDADFKITLAQSYPIEPSKQMESYFLEHCKFARSRPRYVPPELTVTFNGQEVPYLYYGSSYTTLADLQLRNSLVQFSQAEGGKLSGRQVEASVIQHAAADNFDMQHSAREAVDAALEFMNNMTK